MTLVDVRLVCVAREATCIVMGLTVKMNIDPSSCCSGLTLD